MVLEPGAGGLMEVLGRMSFRCRATCRPAENRYPGDVRLGMLLLNRCLPPSLVAGAPQLLETRFTLLDFWELWAELAGVFSQVCCLVAAVCLYRLKRPPSPAKGAALFLTALAGTAICALLPAFWDTVYTLPDYLFISVRTLLPVLVLLCFWCGLALWRKCRRKGN